MKTSLIRLTVCIVITLSFLSPVSSSVLGGITPRTTASGHTLYVGGSGPGNYTRIQDAINAAQDYDTVFVYALSSPYHETLLINHPISLIGENKATTYLDGTGLTNDVITITAPQVTLQGFTIEHAQGAGITISQNTTRVTQMIITGCTAQGILLQGTGSSPVSDCVLENNTIIYTETGITCLSGNHTSIAGNVITQNHYGISLNTSFANTITYNMINQNAFGIVDAFGGHNTYTMNQLSNSTMGIQFTSSTRNTIATNNFIDNHRNAIFSRTLIGELHFLLNALLHHDTYLAHQYHLLGDNKWRDNYWNQSRLIPYPIQGYGTLLPIAHTRMNRVEFDLKPAKTPYDILFYIDTHVNPITPYQQTTSPLNLTVTAPADLSNVTLYYRYQPTNFTKYLAMFQETGFGLTGLDYPDTLDVVNGTAFIASRLNNRIVAYDVRDPTNPQSLWYTQNNTYLSRVNDIKATRDRNYCYTISLNKRWVVMWDVSSHTHALQVAQYQIPDTTGFGMYLAMSADDHYLYATSYHYFLMFNITNKTGHQLDMVYADHIGESPVNLWKPTVYQNTVYVPDGAKDVFNSSLYVYDVTNKASPHRVNTINHSTTCSAACQVYTHSNGFTYLFLGGRSQITPYSIGIINVYNISAGNTTFPKFMYKVRVLDNDTGGHGGNATSGWAVILHDYMFMGINNWNHTTTPNYQNGFWVWNFTNIMKPTLTGRMYGKGAPHYLYYVHYLDLDRNGSDRSVYLAIQNDDCIITVTPTWRETSGGWIKYETKQQSPWSFTFDFPNGTGYYEFYSIGKKVGIADEAPPLQSDAMCHYTATQQLYTPPAEGSPPPGDHGHSPEPGLMKSTYSVH